jgi:hypothetical protein
MNPVFYSTIAALIFVAMTSFMFLHDDKLDVEHQPGFMCLSAFLSLIWIIAIPIAILVGISYGISRLIKRHMK